MKKRLFIAATLLFTNIALFACPTCEQLQPKVLKGITHGAGPESDWDYLIVGVMSLIVLVTLYYSVKWIIKPGEKSSAHIKRMILKFE